MTSTSTARKPDDSSGDRAGLGVTCVSALIAGHAALWLHLSADPQNEPPTTWMIGLILLGMMMLSLTTVMFHPLLALRSIAPAKYWIGGWRLNAMTASFSRTYAAGIAIWTMTKTIGPTTPWGEHAAPGTAVVIAFGALLQPAIACTLIASLQVQQWFNEPEQYSGPGTQTGIPSDKGIAKLIIGLKIAIWASRSALLRRLKNQRLSPVGLALVNDRRWTRRAAAAGAGTAAVAFATALAATATAPEWLRALAGGPAPPILVLVLVPLGYALERAHHTDRLDNQEAVQRSLLVAKTVQASGSFREAGENIVAAGHTVKTCRNQKAESI